MNLDVLRGYDILVCDKKIKEEVIRTRGLLNIKIYTKEEFINKYLFSYDDKTILYLMDKYNYCYEVASMYLSMLYYVKGKCDNNKIDFLVDLKKELDDNNLLIYDDSFIEYAKDKRIVFCGEVNKLIDSILSNLNVTKIDYKYEKYSHKVIEFNSLEEEIEYVAYKICELINKEINPSDICLTNITDNYYHDLERIFSLYNLKVNIPNKMPLISTLVCKKFLNSMDINSVSDYKGTEEYNLIIDILNSTLKYNYDERLIKYKLKHTYLTSIKYSNGIDILDYKNDYIEDKYVFMMNFNEGLIPKTILDTSYISDSICKYTLKEESYIINKKERDDTLNIINNIKNLVITYKLFDNKDSYYPSSLSDNYEIIHDELDNTITYSRTYDQIKLSNYMDYYIKYGSYDEYFKILLNNYKNLYNSYKHEYTGIDKVWDKLQVSYSSLNKYNDCAFKYYVSYVLRIDKFEDNFAARIGSIIHLILKESYDEDFNLEESFQRIISEYEFNHKEMFYLKKYKELLSNVIDTLHEQNKYIELDKYLLEEEIVTDINEKISFKGIIDKVLYKEVGDKTIVSLIDYKTGSDNISLDYIKYGINIQLPIYLYLSSKLPLNNINYAGFYLQKINGNNPNFKLEGYSNRDVNILSYLDNNYMNSSLIKGMKVKTDGDFYSNCKVLSNEEINNIISLVYDEIKNKGEMILNNIFMINPKVINDINYGCKYCKYKDICFSNSNDYLVIKEDTINE